MRHLKQGRKLNRTPSHRRALWRNQAVSLLTHESMQTTLPKAKQLRGFVERLVTLAKKGSLHARRLAYRQVRDKQVLHKLFHELAPRFKQRPGGYTRVMKNGFRRGDNAMQAVIELLPGQSSNEEQQEQQDTSEQSLEPANK